MREAISFHIEGILLEGEPVPAPTTLSRYVDVDAA